MNEMDISVWQKQFKASGKGSKCNNTEKTQSVNIYIVSLCWPICRKLGNVRLRGLIPVIVFYNLWHILMSVRYWSDTHFKISDTVFPQCLLSLKLKQILNLVSIMNNSMIYCVCVGVCESLCLYIWRHVCRLNCWAFGSRFKISIPL